MNICPIYLFIEKTQCWRGLSVGHVVALRMPFRAGFGKIGQIYFSATIDAETTQGYSIYIRRQRAATYRSREDD